MANIVQLVCLTVIGGLGYLLIKRYPRKLQISDCVLIPLFTGVKMILALLSLNLPLFGFPSLRVGISQLPLMIGGVILGPVPAFMLGIVVDVVGLLVTPTDYPFLGFTLGNILTAVLPALVTAKFKDAKNPTRVLYGLLLGIGLINLLTIFFVKEIKFSADVIIELNNLTRFSLLAIISVCLLLVVAIYRVVISRIKENDYRYAVWFTGVILVEFIVNVILTPVWLQIMYGIPFFASSALRIIKATLLINVEGALGYAVLVLLAKVRKKH